jgi:hypothetical protein
MDAIAAWLQDPHDYFSGLELLKSHLSGSFILNILSSGPDSFNTPKLYQEVEKIHNDHKARETKRENEKPADLLKKEESAEQLMDRRAEFKAQLRMLANSDAEQSRRKDIAFTILRIGKELDGIFLERNFYKEHGYLPSGELEADDDPVQLTKRQRTLRTYVTRYSKPGANADKLSAYIEELKIVDAKLDKYAV